jgi:hypothetical protein
MSGEDEAQARYWRNKEQAHRVNFRRKAVVVLDICNEEMSDRGKVDKIASYLEEMCIDF